MSLIFAQQAAADEAGGWVSQLFSQPNAVMWLTIGAMSVMGIVAGITQSWFHHRERMAKQAERIALAERGIHPDGP